MEKKNWLMKKIAQDGEEITYFENRKNGMSLTLQDLTEIETLIADSSNDEKPTNRDPINVFHDAICGDCGAVIPCLESGCKEPPLHDYICFDCLRIEAETRGVDEFDLMCERRYD